MDDRLEQVPIDDLLEQLPDTIFPKLLLCRGVVFFYDQISLGGERWSEMKSDAPRLHSHGHISLSGGEGPQ